MSDAPFTAAYLRSLHPKDHRYEVREPGGLGLWVYPSGKKTWVYTYTVDGRKFRLKLGEYPRVGLAEARKLVVAAKAEIAQGINPQRAKREKRQEVKRQGLTVRDLVRAYIERWAKPRKRSWAEDARRLRADVVRAWGARRASEITRADVRELLDEVMERGPYAANRLFATMRKLFNWAVEVDLLEASPCWQVRMPARERPRERVLTPEEIRAFWWALEGFSEVGGGRLPAHGRGAPGAAGAPAHGPAPRGGGGHGVGRGVGGVVDDPGRPHEEPPGPPGAPDAPGAGAPRGARGGVGIPPTRNADHAHGTRPRDSGLPAHDGHAPVHAPRSTAHGGLGDGVARGAPACDPAGAQPYGPLGDGGVRPPQLRPGEARGAPGVGEAGEGNHGGQIGRRLPPGRGPRQGPWRLVIAVCPRLAARR